MIFKHCESGITLPTHGQVGCPKQWEAWVSARTPGAQGVGTKVVAVLDAS